MNARGVHEQVVQLDAGQVTMRQTSNSSLMALQILLTVDLDTAASGHSDSAGAAVMSRSDRPRTQQRDGDQLVGDDRFSRESGSACG